jgi:Tfp pilus assembly protein PilF
MLSPNKATFDQAVQFLRSGQPQESEKLCLELLRGTSKLTDVHHILALAYRAQGKLSDAERSIRRAVSQSKDNTSILNSYALILLDQNRAKKAIKVLRKALAINGSMVAAHANLGHAHRMLDLPAEAEASYRNTLRINPTHDDALIHLALLLLANHRLAEIDFLPQLETGRVPENPGLAMVYGLVALDQNAPEDAEILFRKALEKQPFSTELLVNLGLSLASQKKVTEARAAYEGALKLNPTTAEAHLNLADLLKYVDPSQARIHLTEVLKRTPDDKSAHDMLGFTWFMERDFDAAVEEFDRAIDIDPQYERAISHKAGAQFLKGDFPAAWLEYNRCRYGENGIAVSPIGNSLPLWNADEKTANPVLVWTEQGLGDEILQLGLVTDLYETGRPLVIATSERLVEITRRTFPRADCVSKDAISSGATFVNQPITQCPAMLIAPVYRKSLESFPKRESYLTANEENSKAIRNDYLRGRTDELLVGISWRSANQTFGNEKSIPINDLIPILSVPGCTFVDLQYGETDIEKNDLPSDIRDRIIRDSNVDSLQNMSMFADQVRALDLIVTTSNTTAHMAGALGRPTWTLVPRLGPGWLWYWFDQAEQCPWYPKMSLFRQQNSGSWQAPISDIAQRLVGFSGTYQ